MKEYQSLSHTRWDCKYHVVFIPKRRKKLIFGKLRKHIGEMLHDLANQKESEILEGQATSVQITLTTHRRFPGILCIAWFRRHGQYG